MPYRFLEDVALADVAFEATGTTLEEVFISAAAALTAVMIKPEEVQPNIEHDIDLSEESVERLLYDWLSELVYIKDTESLLFRTYHIKIHEGHKGYAVKGKIYGEEIRRNVHNLITDVKAVTMHLFEVKKVEKEWKATVVLDI